jgi:hypothetical protein
VVVLARTRNDGVAERGHQLINSIQLEGSSQRHRIHDAKPVGFLLEERADRHVGLDVHHHEMLAVLHRHQIKIRRNARLTGRIDHHVDQRVGDQQLVRRDRDPAAFDGLGDFGSGFSFACLCLVAIGNPDRIAGGMRPPCRDGRDFDPPHEHARHQSSSFHPIRSHRCERAACVRASARSRRAR